MEDQQTGPQLPPVDWHYDGQVVEVVNIDGVSGTGAAGTRIGCEQTLTVYTGTICSVPYITSGTSKQVAIDKVVDHGLGYHLVGDGKTVRDTNPGAAALLVCLDPNSYVNLIMGQRAD
jgi:hypothetical protein